MFIEVLSHLAGSQVLREIHKKKKIESKGSSAGDMPGRTVDTSQIQVDRQIQSEQQLIIRHLIKSDHHHHHTNDHCYSG